MTRARLASLRLLLAAAAAVAAVHLVASPALAQSGSDGLVLGSDLVVESGETIQGDVAVVGGSLTMEEGSTIEGDAMASFGGPSVIGGAVEGNVFVGGDLELTSTADVSGDVVALGAIDRDPDAVVGGRVMGGAMGLVPGGGGEAAVPQSRSSQLASGLVAVAGWTLFFMLISAVVVAVAPGAIARVNRALSRRTGGSFAVGCAAWILFVPLLLLLLITIIGPFILMGALVVAVLLGWVALAKALGARIMGGTNRIGQALLGAAIIGVLYYSGLVLGAFWIKCFAVGVAVLLTAAPLGAALMTVFGTRDWPALEAAPPAPPPPAPPPAPQPDGEPPALAAQPEATTRSDEAATPAAPASNAAAEASAGGNTSAESDKPTEASPPASGDAPEATERGEPAPPAAATSTALTDVPGITPVYALLLREAGIATPADLAAADPAWVAEVASSPGVIPVSEDTARSWIASAADVVSG